LAKTKPRAISKQQSLLLSILFEGLVLRGIP